MSPPRIFDTDRERWRRKARPPRLPEDLRQRLGEDLADRLALVRRPFPRLLICGPLARHLAGVAGAEGRTVLVDGIDLELDPENLALPPAELDCIISIFGLETVNDLPGALIQMRRALKPDGFFLACLFAGETLHELRAAWLEAEAAMLGGASLRVAPFADVRELGALLQRAGFALPVADLDRTTLRYADALALMREIRALGFAPSFHERSRRPVTAGLLARVAAAYASRATDADGRLRATVEIAWLTGWSPHESHPQPLKPGSARARLADALSVREMPLKR